MWAIVARSFYEMRLMTERYVSDGMIFGEGDDERLAALLGRPLHAYRETAETSPLLSSACAP